MWPAIAGALGMSGLSAGMDFVSANQQYQRSLGMMREQERWQEKMSSTAYQRATSDMKAAGLNPALMYGSGGPASTPSGGLGSVPSTVGALGGMASSAISAAQTKIDLDTAVKQRDLMGAQKLTQDKTAEEVGNRARLVGAQADQEELIGRWAKENPKSYLFFRAIQAAASTAKDISSAVSNVGESFGKSNDFYVEPGSRRRIGFKTP